jgi:hypothetical protein
MTHTRNGIDPRPTVIEFIGGPYDGHKEPCLTETARLPADVVWCVCDDAFRMLEGRASHPGGSITSVAFYELEATNDARRYRFTRSISLDELMDSMPETRSCLDSRRDKHHEPKTSKWSSGT